MNLSRMEREALVAGVISGWSVSLRYIGISTSLAAALIFLITSSNAALAMIVVGIMQSLSGELLRISVAKMSEEDVEEVINSVAEH